MLDAIGIALGADKSSVRADNRCAWDYSRFYEDIFREFQNDDINLIEIGVGAGASLRMWLRYFERARIVGIDVIPECVHSAGGRAEVRIGSQTDEVFLRDLAQEFPPTIIIDDGSHVSEHIVKSFEILFPLLRPGGFYVIEDVAFHFNGNPASYSPSHGPYPSGSVQDLVNRLLFAKLTFCNTGLPYSDIDEVRLINGAVFIKKIRPRDHGKTKQELEKVLDSHAAHGASYGYACFRMAEFLMAYHNDPILALQYIEKGAVTLPNFVYGLQLKFKALTELKRDAEALAIARRLEHIGAPITWEPVFTKEAMAYPHP